MSTINANIFPNMSLINIILEIKPRNAVFTTNLFNHSQDIYLVISSPI